MKSIIKISLCISALLLMNGYAFAQFSTTMSSMEKARETSLWFTGSANAAGMTIDQTVHGNEVAVAYDHSSGDFKRLFTGDSETKYAFVTQGGSKVGGSYLWGGFGYGRINRTGTLWNANLTDPYRETPYYMADPHLSDWKIDSYDLQMKISFPFLFGDKLAFGASVDYLAERGEKTIYPTATNSFHTIDFKPGLVYRLSPSLFVGLSGEYFNLYEANTPNRGVLDEPVRQMRGLGFSMLDVVANFTLQQTYMQKELWGGELQLGAQHEKSRLLLAAGYRNGVDETILRHRNAMDQSSFFKELLGALLSRELYLKLNATLSAEQNIHLIKAEVNNAYRRGVEAVEVMGSKQDGSSLGQYIAAYQSVRSTYNRLDFNASYDYFRGRSHNDYHWRAGAFLGYHSDKDDYIMPVGKQHWSGWDVGLNLKYNFTFNSGCNLLAGVNFLNHQNLGKEFVYEGPEADPDVVNEFVIPDFAYRTASYNKIAGSVVYSIKMKKIGHFIAAEAGRISGNDLSRTFFNIKIGLYF